MKAHLTATICCAILFAACGCVMDPPMRWKASQIKPVDDSGPGIAVRTLEAEIWGRTELSEPSVVVTGANGVRWEISATGKDPSKWRAYRTEPGKKPQEVPFGPLYLDDPHSTLKGEETVIFTGSVENVELLGHRNVDVFPVGIDAKFLLTMRVVTVEQNTSSPIAANRTMNFAIHSPSQLFGTENATGKRFKFMATWTFGSEPKRFSWIEARPAPK